jgi:5-methylcytosine-specific restriction endonuclease McrA
MRDATYQRPPMGTVKQKCTTSDPPACLRCGKPRSRNKRKKYCSLACAYAQARKQRQPCPVCGKPRPLPRKTCSAKCGYEFRKRSLRSQKKCPLCGVMFWPVNRRYGHSVFCGKKCHVAHQRTSTVMVKVPCVICGTTVLRHPTRVRPNATCGRACLTKSQMGSRSALWRGGSDPNRGRGWVKLAESIRMRDKYQCQRCTRTQEENGQKLSVDHIKPWRLFASAEEANSPHNLVSLCRRCHSSKTSSAERQFLKGDVMGMLRYRDSIGRASEVRK